MSLTADQLLGLFIIGVCVGFWLADVLRDGTRRPQSAEGGIPQEAPPFPSHRSPSSGMAAESSRTVSFHPESRRV